MVSLTILHWKVPIESSIKKLIKQVGCSITVISKTVVSHILAFMASQKTTVTKSLPTKFSCANNCIQLSDNMPPETAAP